MAGMRERDDVHALVEMANQMGEAELRRDEAVLRRILDDDLRFRRANGQIVSKGEFLADLQDPGNSFACLESDVVDVSVSENTAIVVLIVRAKGTRRWEPFEGAFRNMRLFIRDPEVSEGAWRCAMWLNAKIGKVGC